MDDFLTPSPHTSCSSSSSSSSSPSTQIRIPDCQLVLAPMKKRENYKKQFNTLLSVVPNVSKMDKESLLAGAVCYINQLKQKVEELESELEMSESPTTKANNGNCNKKNIQVKMVGEYAIIRVQSANSDWPALKLMSALGKMEAKIQHATMSCLDGVMFQDCVAKIPGAKEDEVKAYLRTRLNK